MKLKVEPYLYQKDRWPTSGKVILAQYSPTSIVVYQAYRPSIGHFAVQNGYFGGEFKFDRMTWIKPNFLWMMYRSGWGTKAGQEVILAIHLQRSGFDSILDQAVHSKFIPKLYPTQKDWRMSVRTSNVRLQWDPDHSPTGGKLQRRAIQLGLQHEALMMYVQEWIMEIEDISAFVTEQRQHVVDCNYDELLVPQENLYPVGNVETAKKLQLSSAI